MPPMSVDQAILRLVRQHAITEQAEILSRLAQQGILLTQSTLSRRLRKLSVVKLDGRYQHLESMRPPAPTFSVQQAPPNLLVVKLGPGLAQPTAMALDQGEIEGIIGTVAGDDTVLVVVQPAEKLPFVQAEIEELLENAR